MVIGIEGFGASVLKDTIRLNGWEEIGCYLIPELSLRGTNLDEGLRKGICSIWRSKSSSDGQSSKDSGIILVHADQRVPHHRANAWAAVLMNAITADRSVIFLQFTCFNTPPSSYMSSTRTEQGPDPRRDQRPRYRRPSL